MLGRSWGRPLAAWHSLEALWPRHQNFLVLELTAPKASMHMCCRMFQGKGGSQYAFVPRRSHETCVGCAKGHTNAHGGPGWVVLEVDQGPLFLTMCGASLGQAMGSCGQSGARGASHHFCVLFAEVCWQLQPRSRRR